MSDETPDARERLRPLVSELCERASARARPGVALSELGEAMLNCEATEEEIAFAHDLLEKRGVQLSDDCGRPGVPPTRYANPLLAARTTDAMALYLCELPRHPVLTRGEEAALAERAETGDPRAKEQLINANLRLVVVNARRYRAQGLPLLDLIQEGVLGLTRAVERFDHRWGFKFFSYATFRIRRAMRRATERGVRLIRLPLVPGEAERVLHCRKHAPTAHGSVALGNVSSTLAEPEEEIVEVALGEAGLARGLGELRPPDAELIRLRYGLSGEEPVSLGRAADSLGIGRAELLSQERYALVALARSRELQAPRQSA
jgi:RNA polymerase primary sigma factor